MAYNLIYTAVGSIAVVAILIWGTLYLASNFVTRDIENQLTARELNALSLSYKIEDCLTKDSNIVDSVFLEENKGKNICTICDICNIIAEAVVIDIETGKKWRFDYTAFVTIPPDLNDKISVWKADSRKKEYSLYLNIGYGMDSHIGRLVVNV
jgi:hypothetical protein